MNTARPGTPGATRACPHCKATSPVALVVGTAIAFTLMACYGRPPCHDGTQKCHEPLRDAAGQTGPTDASTNNASGSGGATDPSGAR